MTMTRGLRALLTVAALLGVAWLAKQTLARLNGTVVRDVRSGR